MIYNSNFSIDNCKRIPIETSVLYEPNDFCDWLYCHHPYIISFKGKLYAMWSNGRFHEDFPRQRAMMAVSQDGIKWSSPQVLLEAPHGEFVPCTLLPTGFFINNDTLYAYIGCTERHIDALISVAHMKEYYENTGYDHEYFDQFLFPQNQFTHTKIIVLSTKDGQNWRKEKSIELNMLGNMPPIKLLNGALILAGHGIKAAISQDNGENWRRYGLFNELDIDQYTDAFDNTMDVCKRNGLLTALYENVVVELNNKLFMLFRSNERVLYVSESADFGLTWSSPQKTAFTNDNARFQIFSLNDGRYAYVGNPLLDSGRCPLVLSISKDGIEYNKHFIIQDQLFSKKFQGIAKGGIAAYPYAVQKDHYIYIIYSVQKERIMVTRVRIEDVC
mgnify:CR=1 FL=1